MLFNILQYLSVVSEIETKDYIVSGPPRLPLYGSYWIVLWREIDNLGGSLRKLARDYKTDVLGMYLGNFPAIVIDDPKLMKEGLNHQDFDGRVDVIVARLRSFWKKLGKFITLELVKYL